MRCRKQHCLAAAHSPGLSCLCDGKAARILRVWEKWLRGKLMAGDRKGAAGEERRQTDRDPNAGPRLAFTVPTGFKWHHYLMCHESTVIANPSNCCLSVFLLSLWSYFSLFRSPCLLVIRIQHLQSCLHLTKEDYIYIWHLNVSHSLLLAAIMLLCNWIQLSGSQHTDNDKELFNIDSTIVWLCITVLCTLKKWRKFILC